MLNANSPASVALTLSEGLKHMERERREMMFRGLDRSMFNPLHALKSQPMFPSSLAILAASSRPFPSFAATAAQVSRWHLDSLSSVGMQAGVNTVFPWFEEDEPASTAETLLNYAKQIGQCGQRDTAPDSGEADESEIEFRIAIKAQGTPDACACVEWAQGEVEYSIEFHATGGITIKAREIGATEWAQAYQFTEANDEQQSVPTLSERVRADMMLSFAKERGSALRRSDA